MDQDALSLAEAAHHHQRNVGRRVVDRKGSALLVAPAIGERDCLVTRDGDHRRLAAEPGARHHLVADLDVLHPLAHGFDIAGDLVADGAGWLGRLGVEADARHRVREVDAGGLDRDPHLAGAHRGIRLLLNLEHLRASVLRDDDRPHGTTLQRDSSPDRESRKLQDSVDRRLVDRSIGGQGHHSGLAIGLSAHGC